MYDVLPYEILSKPFYQETTQQSTILRKMRETNGQNIKTCTRKHTRQTRSNSSSSMYACIIAPSKQIHAKPTHTTTHHAAFAKPYTPHACPVASHIRCTLAQMEPTHPCRGIQKQARRSRVCYSQLASQLTSQQGAAAARKKTSLDPNKAGQRRCMYCIYAPVGNPTSYHIIA